MIADTQLPASERAADGTFHRRPYDRSNPTLLGRLVLALLRSPPDPSRVRDEVLLLLLRVADRVVGRQDGEAEEGPAQRRGQRAVLHALVEERGVERVVDGETVGGGEGHGHVDRADAVELHGGTPFAAPA